MKVTDDAAWLEAVKRRYVHVHTANFQPNAPRSYCTEEDALIAILIANQIEYSQLLK